ncbi:MAG: hypothetical protein AAGK32_15360, partial [Actinomycetota bacterium]
DRAWIGLGDGTLAVHRYSDGERLTDRKDLFSAEVLEIVPFEDGDQVRVAATDGLVVAVLDADLEPVVERPAPDAAIFSLAVDDSTGQVAAGTGDGSVLLWSGTDVAPDEELSVADDAIVTAVEWLDDTTIVTADQTGAVQRWDLDDPDEPAWTQSEATASPGSWVQALASVPEGPIATGGEDGSVGFLDVDNGAVNELGATAVHAGEVTDLAYTGDRAEAGSVASVAEDGFLLFWDHEQARLLSLFPPQRVDEGAATSLGWDRANPLQGIVGGVDGGALFLDYGDDQRRPIASISEQWTDAAAVALSADGTRLAVATTEPVLTITDPENPSDSDDTIRIDALVESMTFTPDGEYVVAGLGDGTLVVWDGEGPAETINVQPGWVLGRVAVSPDGTRIAAGAADPEPETVQDSTVRLWRFEDGQPEAERGRTELAVGLEL